MGRKFLPMSSLIICLPSAASSATASYDYALTTDGRTLSDHGSVPLALLPVAERRGEVVAIVPVGLLSWHSVELPKGIGLSSPRLRAVLEGLLEDQLLDDSEQLHLALAPAVVNGRVWVAACDKNWLRGHLHALELAQRPASRIIPEFTPEIGPLQLHAVGAPDLPQLVMLGEAAGGVIRLPLTAEALALVPANSSPDEETLVMAEPGLAELAEHLLKRKVSLLTCPQRWLEATQSPWDLAQFDLISSGRARTVKRMSSVGRELLQAPGWRAARWGTALLLLANLIGLNAWAWKEQSGLQSRRAAVQGTLLQTFPSIKVVVDAPLQMEREVAALRQSTGAVSERDLEALLVALGSAMPGKSASAIEFLSGEARVKGLQITAPEGAGLSAQLKSQGFNLRLEGDLAIIKQDIKPDVVAP